MDLPSPAARKLDSTGEKLEIEGLSPPATEDAAAGNGQRKEKVSGDEGRPLLNASSADRNGDAICCCCRCCCCCYCCFCGGGGCDLVCLQYISTKRNKSKGKEEHGESR